LAAGVARQVDFAGTQLPTYGGIGTFGLNGPGLDPAFLSIQDNAAIDSFTSGRTYNVEASAVIKDGTGASGAHSDIAHPEVAHLIWSAARG
jgi:hypothetical protein